MISGRTTVVPDAPADWHWCVIRHEHTPIVFLGDTHQPLPHADGAWCASLQHERGGRLTKGRGRTMEEAMQRAVDEVRRTRAT